MRNLLALSIFAAASVLGCTGVESHDVAFQSGRNATVWHPAQLASCGAKLPVVVFSHGFGGCSKQILFFTEALAQRGYIVIAPDHLDATCGADENPPAPEVSFAKPEDWTDETYASRRDDLRAALDFVMMDASLAAHADASRIAGAGHSLGGYSMMATGGAWANWIDPRYRALLLFSPYSTPFLEQNSVGQIQVPVMYQGGQLDIGVTPYIAKRGGVYDSSNPEKYFVEFFRAGHLAWTNATPASDPTAKLINQYSFAFLDRYLKGEPQPLLTPKPHRDVADFRMAIGK